MTITFNPDIKLILDDLLLTHPLVHTGKMFGYPAYYVGKKLCMCLFEQGVGVKVPADTATCLSRGWGSRCQPILPPGCWKTTAM
jgi:hypothetical protein